MSKIIRTEHTVLAQVTSHNSGGRAEMLVHHPALVRGYSDPFLTSRYFTQYPVDSLVVAKIKLSGKRRLIQRVTAEGDITSIASFREIYKSVIAQEAKRYERLHGTKAEEVEVHAPTVEAPPELDDTEWATRIYIEPADNKLLETIKVLSTREHTSIMMIGPSGYGKTSIPEQKAKDWGMDFLRWDCATVRDPEEFFGFRGAKDGSTMDEDGTIFEESEFTRKVQEGNVVIVLDELNRIDPYISNILFPLLDHAGQTSVAGHHIEVGPNVIFVATVNLGFQFTGTFTLDTALTNRFNAKVLVKALPEEIETKILMARTGVSSWQAEQIVKLMSGLRGLNDKGELSIDASTRVSIQLGKLIGAGLTLKEALIYVVVNGISEEEAKLVVDEYRYVT